MISIFKTDDGSALVRSKRLLTFAFAFPMLVLLGLVFTKQKTIVTGKEVIFKVSGYDPRDLLSGHFVIYRVNYEVPNLCDGVNEPVETYVCLDQRTFSHAKPELCTTFIRGRCEHSIFLANIERFYIPDTQAIPLDERTRAGAASIRVSISPSGQAVVTDLLIDGKSYKEP